MDARGSGMLALAPWAFIGFGALIVLVGVLSAFSDTAALAAIPFGAVFIGAGWFARRLLAVPPGMKAITTEAAEAGITRLDGTTGRRRQGSVIHVPEDADEDEARAAWLRERLAERPDWAAGRITPEGERGGSLLAWTAGIWTVATLAALAAGLIWGGIAWLIAAGAALTALPPLYWTVRERLQRRKFAASAFAADALPFRLGGRLSGTVETGIGLRHAETLRFQVTLSCTHRWEETRGSGSDRRTVQRSDVLWSGEAETPARIGPHGRVLAPVDLAIPADRPPSSLGAISEGVAWQLSVTAPMPGLDYAVAFIVPVIAADARL